MVCQLIKIEIRNNLIYPVMFTISVNILNIIRILLKEVIKINLLLIYPLLLFISTVFFSSLFLYIQSRKKTSKKKPYLMNISLIQGQIEMNRIDNTYVLFARESGKDTFRSIKHPKAQIRSLDSFYNCVSGFDADMQPDGGEKCRGQGVL